MFRYLSQGKKLKKLGTTNHIVKNFSLLPSFYLRSHNRYNTDLYIFIGNDNESNCQIIKGDFGHSN